MKTPNELANEAMESIVDPDDMHDDDYAASRGSLEGMFERAIAEAVVAERMRIRDIVRERLLAWARDAEKTNSSGSTFRAMEAAQILVREAIRLRLMLEEADVDVDQCGPDAGVHIQASFDPADGETAIIELYGLVDADLPVTVTAALRARPTFEEAWAEKELAGFRYGRDALEQVRLGWNLCEAAYRAARKP